MTYCHSIDWLQLHVKCPVTISAQDNFKYHVVKQDGQTRHFREVYEISVLTEAGNFETCATLATKPHSSFLGADMGLLKIANKYLYSPDLIGFVNELLRQFNFRFHAISRIDVALDFQQFNGGLPPETFIKRFLSGEVLKRQKSSFSVVGDHHAVNNYKYLRFGSRTSEICYYLYNKSAELAENKEKPWIRDYWKAAGFDTAKDVWRIEFSIKSSARELLDIETGEIIPFKALEVCQPEISFLLYKALFYKYFSFVKAQGISRKDRMEPVDLLTLEKPMIAIVRTCPKMESTRMDKVFIKRLEQHNIAMRSIDVNYAFYGAKLLYEYIERRGLIKWYLQRFPNGTADLTIMAKKAGFVHDEYLQATLI